jgi:hypothetical protein
LNAQTQRFVVGTHAGRLLEARVLSLVTAEDVVDFTTALRETLDDMPSRMAVLCADHRYANIYPQVVTDRLVELFLAMNARLERVAIVVGSTKPTFLMQMRRVAREAENEARQVFPDPESALQHLRVALDPLELVRAREFLAEPPPS